MFTEDNDPEFVLKEIVAPREQDNDAVWNDLTTNLEKIVEIMNA